MMHHTEQESGFAAVKAFLLFVLLIIIGCTGYFVWRSGQAATDSYNKASKHEDATVTKQTYTNKDFNLTFTYPASWGKARTASQDLEKPVAGSSYAVTFSTDSGVGSYFASKDWQPTRSATPPNIFNLTKFDHCAVPAGSKDVFVPIFTDSTTCVGVRGTVIDDGIGHVQKLAFLFGEKKLDSSKAPVIEFYGASRVVTDVSKAALQPMAATSADVRAFVSTVQSAKSL